MSYSLEELLRREHIVRRYKRGDLSSQRAAQLLQCTTRQVRRMLQTLTGTWHLGPRSPRPGSRQSNGRDD